MTSRRSLNRNEYTRAGFAAEVRAWARGGTDPRSKMTCAVARDVLRQLGATTRGQRAYATA